MTSSQAIGVKATLRSLSSSCIELWRYRHFILGSVARELRSKHTRSLLGSAWLLLAPFSMILVYTLVFSRIMHARMPGTTDPFAYSIYLCAGSLPWQWFSELLTRNINIFVDHGGLIKKSTFPRMALPAIAFLSSACNFLLVEAIFLLFLVVIGSFPGWPILWVIPLLLVQSLFAASLGLALGVLNVFFRDVGQAMGIVLQFWFWLTPIVYPANALPEWAHSLLYIWNPVAGLFGGYQRIFLGQGAPLWITLWPLAIVTIISLLLAMIFYRAGRDQLTDEL